jgi:hypothetical protein
MASPTPTSLPTHSSARSTRTVTQRYFLVLVFFIIGCGVTRSWWATALDGFTVDEAYHIAAGANYVRFHDFRVNPEHPPLVKLIAGVTASPSILHLSPPPHLEGKAQEREYAETAVYINSNARLIQRRARITMLAFHSLLFGVFAAGSLYWRARQLTYLNPPDPVKAEALFRRVIELEPHSYTARIELGNFALKRQDLSAALSSYRAALDDAPPQFRSNIAEQIAKLATTAPSAVLPLQNPSLE